MRRRNHTARLDARPAARRLSGLAHVKALGLRLLAFILVAMQWSLLIVLLLLVAWQAQPTRWWAGKLAAGIASRALGQQVSTGVIEGSMPWNVKLPWLRVSDGGNPWLELRALKVKADWRAALRGNWILEHVTIATIDLHDWPENRRKRAGDATRQSSRWTPFRIRTLRVDQITLPAPGDTRASVSLHGRVTGHPESIRFHGRTLLHWLDARGVIEGESAWTRNGPETDLAASLDLGDATQLPWPGATSFSNLTAQARITGGGTHPLKLVLQADVPQHGSMELSLAQSAPSGAEPAWDPTAARFAATVTPRNLTPRLHDRLGVPWRLHGNLTWDATAKRLTCSNGSLATPVMDGLFSGFWDRSDPAGPRYQGQLQGEWAPDPYSLLDAGIDVGDALAYRLSIAAADGRTTASLDIETPWLDPASRVPSPDLRLQAPSLSLRADRPAPGHMEWQGHFTASDRAGQPISLSAQARLDDTRLTLTDSRLQWGPAHVAATGTWDRAAQVLSGAGSARTRIEDWLLWPEGAGTASASGWLDIDFQSHGDLAEGRTHLSLGGYVADGAYEGQAFDLALICLQVERVLSGVSAGGWLSIQQATFGNGTLIVDHATAHLMAGDHLIDWDFDLEGAAAMHPLWLSGRGGLSRDSQRWHVAELHAHAPPLTLKNRAAFMIRRTPDRWLLPKSRWMLNETADLALSGWVSPDHRMLDVTTELSGALRPGEWVRALEARNWTLETQTQAHLWGPLRAPRLRLDSTTEWDEPLGRRLIRRALASVAVTLNDDGGRVDAGISAGDSGLILIDAHLPLHDPGGNGGWQWVEAADAKADVSGRIDLGWLLTAWVPDALRLTGLGEIKAGLRWQPGSHPQIEGSVNATDLALDAPQWGLQMGEGRLKVEADPDAFLRIDGTLSDVFGNPLALDGTVEWDPADGLQLDLRAEAPRFVPLRTESVTITTRNSIGLSGRPGNLMLSGRVRLLEASLSGVPALPLDVPRLAVEEFGNRQTRTAPAPARAETADFAPAPPGAATGLTCDLRFSVSSESLFTSPDARMRWQGDLELRGPVSDLNFQGRFSLLRGHLMLLGRRLTLQDGFVLFTGPPLPEIEIVAESRAGGVVAQVIVTGPANRPTFRVASDPPMADDEIMAYILFRRGLARIGPYQAYQLAQVLRRLQGGEAGGGLDLLGHGRRLLPVDEIDLVYTDQETSDEEAAALQVGRYLGSRLYVAGTQGLETGTGRVSLDVELTRRITLETEIRADMRSGLGLSWKWDY